MTFGELCDRMDATELVEWTQFDRIHHSPARVDTALLCLRMDRLAGNNRTKLDDYLPKRLEPDRPADPNIVDRLKAWAGARIANQRHAPRPTVFS